MIAFAEVRTPVQDFRSLWGEYKLSYLQNKYTQYVQYTCDMILQYEMALSIYGIHVSRYDIYIHSMFKIFDGIE